MKKIFIIILLFILTISFYNNILVNYITDIPKKYIIDAKKNNCDYLIYVDYSKPRIFSRFFLYSLKEEKIISSSVCTTGLNKNKFSNVVGSNLTSLGKYKVLKSTRIIKNKYISKELIGLDKTNNNAYKRGILIHYCQGMDLMQYTIPIFIFKMSQGCFVVNNSTLQKVLELKKANLYADNN